MSTRPFTIVVALATLSLLAQLEPDGVAQTAPEATLLAAFIISGSTPSMAWSPDGAHLAFNQAYDYYGYDHLITSNSDNLGLWAYNAADHEASHLVHEQRYHPTWLGDDQIGNACSIYQDCTNGIYLTGLDGAETQLSTAGFHTVAASSDTLLYTNDYTWIAHDIATGDMSAFDEESCSWEPPSIAQDQCIQEAGGVRVWADQAGLWIQRGDTEAVVLDHMPGFLYDFSSPWDCNSSINHNTYVAPCLSPNATQVAYFSGQVGATTLRIHATGQAAAPADEGTADGGGDGEVEEVITGHGDSGDMPGQSGDAPGHGGEGPGHSEDAPGHGGENPGHGGEPPGQSDR